MTLSDTYKDFRVSDLQKFGDMVDHANVNQYNGLRYVKVNKEYIGFHNLSDVDNLKSAYFDLAHEKITFGEVKYLVHRAEELCQGCEAYTKYKMLKLFSSNDKKGKNFYGPPPGTVRIFSRHLISYWNGKDWRKISLPGL